MMAGRIFGRARLIGAASAQRQLCTAAASAVSDAGPIMNFARTQPYKFNIVVATLKTAACDLLVQKFIERKEEISWKRNAVFAAFGCVYLGGLQWFMYVDVFKRLWPGMATFANQSLREKLANPAGLRALCGQVAFDNFVHYPFIYFPFFYVFKETIQGDSVNVETVVPVGLSKYAKNAREDNLSMWALWVPGDLIVYAVPLWMRLPLNHGFSFVWTCYLSFLRGDEATDGSPLKNRGAGKLPWTASGADLAAMRPDESGTIKDMEAALRASI